MIEEGKYDNLIWSIVHKTLAQINDKYYYKGLEEDLFQEGYLGLLDALNKYDDSSNTQFSTFAYKYIYGYCLNYLKREYASLRCEDIDSSPATSEESYDIDTYLEFNLFEELNNRLKSINKSISKEEEKILNDRLLKEYSLRKCAELNHCSTRKVTNVIDKYKNLIKEILIN